MINKSQCACGLYISYRKIYIVNFEYVHYHAGEVNHDVQSQFN